MGVDLAVLPHSYGNFFLLDTDDFSYFLIFCFFFLQVVKAFSSGQLEKIWNTSVKRVVIALLTNIFEIREINVNTVDLKNASSWA